MNHSVQYLEIVMKEFIENEELSHLRNSESPSEESDHNLSSFAKYKCNLCLEIADEPVLAECGHLFCWKCLEEALEESSYCSVCGGLVNESRLIPIYTHTNKINKPKPQHRQPVRNSNAVSNEVPFHFRLKNNINLRVNLAGYGYFPSSFALLFNNYSEPRDLTHPEKEVKSMSRKLEVVLVSLVLVTVLVIMLNLEGS